METLKKLAKIVNRYKQKNIDILLVDQPSKSKTNLLYEALHSDQIDSDEQAMDLIYGENKHNQSAFSKLKYRLRDKLIDSIFFIDFARSERFENEKAKMRVSKTWAASQIIYSMSFTYLSRSMIEYLLPTCEKYDLIEFKMLILNKLIPHYSISNFNKVKLEYFKKEHAKTLHQYTLACKIESIYYDIGRIIISQERQEHTQEMNLLEQRLNIIYEDVLATNLVMPCLHAYESKYILLEYKDALETQFQICEEALDFFRKKNFDLLPKFRFLQKRGLTLVQLNRFDEGLSDHKTCAELITKSGNIRWHFTYSYILSTYLFKKEYDNVYITLSYFVHHKDIGKLPSQYRESWHLKEALTQLMIMIGLISPEKIDVKPLKKFRLSRFINEVHIMTKDKTGSNITLYILQLLFLIVTHQSEKTKNKIAALRQYSYRHMRHEDFDRTKLFIKMLGLIDKHDYDVNLIEQKTKKYLEQLIALKPRIKERMMATAFIPFEEIWHGILAHERQSVLLD